MDIDFNYINEDTEESNIERMMCGVAPYGKDDHPIELHHVLQQEVEPVVEIHETTHREYKTILHGLISFGDSFRQNKDLDNQYRNFKRIDWKWRAKIYLEAITQ